MVKHRHSIARLREVITYKPRKGIFVWRIYTRCHGRLIKPGDVAGSRPNGKSTDRIGITFEGKQYRAHILAYAFTKNEWPPKGMEVDHKDGK